MEIKNYSKAYGDKIIFDNLSLTIEDGSITAIMGNSGTGKTTLLNALARLDTNFKGEISCKKCSYVFQEPRLLKGVTVYKNIELALPKPDDKRVTDILKEVELLDEKDLFDNELSGGMAQRVSLARAFVTSREVLLMDEPFTGLDMGLKLRLYELFKRLYEKHKPTVVLVTHDLEEALTLANRIIILGSSPATILLDEQINNNTEELRERIKELFGRAL